MMNIRPRSRIIEVAEFALAQGLEVVVTMVLYPILLIKKVVRKVKQ